jgi:hypothetical protein
MTALHPPVDTYGHPDAGGGVNGLRVYLEPKAVGVPA